MYNFVDTTERYPGQNLPSEALMFNGSYLENVIPGYRTLYVSGREILGTEITDLETGVSDGTKYRRKRYQPRTIVVGYQLVAEDNAAFRSAYNKLNALLDAEQATLILQMNRTNIISEQSRERVKCRREEMRSLRSWNFTARIHSSIRWKNLR